jgi:Reverse transcriptase (RNA-dependent DNA polymerase)/DNA N-6-adenine-methyltransferase (Dam)
MSQEVIRKPQVSTYYAGRLMHFIDEWHKITSDNRVLSYVQGLQLPFRSYPNQTIGPMEPSWSLSEQEAISHSILELSNNGAICTVEPIVDQYVSKIFLVPKADGGSRLILNLKSLNSYIWADHFKLEDHKTVAKIIQRGMYMGTIDLKDAYLMVPIFEPHRKYLRFSFQNKLYQYNCMPFGLNCAPLVFTKLLRPALSYLRSRGFLSVLYLDDFLIFGTSYRDCLKNIKSTIVILNKLGFIINYEKSKLVPSHQVKYLGFLYNSMDMSISLPQEKIDKVIKLLKKFSALQECTIREFAEFLGTLCSICTAVRYGWVYTKLFERQKFLALRKSGDNYNCKMVLPPTLKEDFTWWLQRVPCARNNIKVDSYRLEIFSDASKTGWGAFCNGKRCHGFWSDLEREEHINILELKAAFLALKSFASYLSDCNVLCRVDNTTALAYINRMGSVQYPTLNKLSRLIWQWCETRNIFLFASYIPSQDNAEADAESRKRLAQETEWQLNNSAFQKIVSSFGSPAIDLFASKDNQKCQKYISWQGEPGCIAVDAFTVNWNSYFFYAFPPFSLILRVLQKIIEDRARGIVVVPLWPTQPWFPLFSSMLENNFIVFQPSKDLLSFNRMPHPIWNKITLAAGILSYNH